MAAAVSPPTEDRAHDSQHSEAELEARRQSASRVSFGAEASPAHSLTTSSPSKHPSESPSRRPSGYRRASFVNGERIKDNQLPLAAIAAAQHAAAVAAAEQPTRDEDEDEDETPVDETEDGDEEASSPAERSQKSRKHARVSDPNVVSTADILSQRLQQSILEDGAILAEVPLPFTMPGVKYSTEGLPIPLPAKGGLSLYKRTNAKPPPELIQASGGQRDSRTEERREGRDARGSGGPSLRAVSRYPRRPSPAAHGKRARH